MTTVAPWPLDRPPSRFERMLLDRLPLAYIGAVRTEGRQQAVVQRITLEGGRATVTPAGPDSTTALDLPRYVVVSARPVGSTPEFTARSRWMLTVRTPDGPELDIVGAWWRIRQLAEVGGWPYPNDDAPHRVVDLVRWPVRRDPVWLSVAGWTGTVAAFVGGLFVRETFWRPPYDARKVVTRRGDRPLKMPAVEIVADTAHRLTAYGTSVPVVVTSDAARVLVHGRGEALPLQTRQPLRLETVRPGRGTLHAKERWRLVVGDEERQVTFEGGWFTLAWLAHLGGWSMPAIPGRFPVLGSGTRTPRTRGPVRYRP